MYKIPCHINETIPYKSGKPIQEIRRELKLDKIAKLGSNENTLGVSPKAVNAISTALRDLHWYPESACIDSREVFANFNGTKKENIIIGNGSEGVLSCIFKTFLEANDEILTSEGTFIGIYVLSQVNNLRCKKVALTRKLSYDLDQILASITEKTRLIYLANPNNPTGTIFSKTEFEKFMTKVPIDILVILDEAYYEFAISLSKVYPSGGNYCYKNLITLRTFSKAYGLAGMRIGYGIASSYLVSAMMKVKLPFEPSILAQKAGMAAISDTEFLIETIENNKTGLNYFYTEFATLKLDFYRSNANFILVDFKSIKKVKEINSKLLARGVIVRSTGAFGLPNCIRISVGMPHENKQCVDALKSIL